MKVIFLFVIVCALGVSAQRRVSKLDDTKVEASPTSSNARGRGRARFTTTPEFEAINNDESLDTKKIAKRIDAPKKLPENAKAERRASRPAKEPLKLYEVSETVDDIPREEEMKKIVLAAPRVITESKFESLNIAKPLPIPSSSTTEENTPNYPKLPPTASEVTQSADASILNEATAAVSDVPKITPDLSRKIEATTVKVKPTIKQKIPHRRFNVKSQSTTEKSEETTAAGKRKRVRGQTNPGTTSTTAASIARKSNVRQNRKRVENVADSGPSVFNSEGRDSRVRSRPGRTVSPTLEKRIDDADAIYFAGDAHPREIRSKSRYSSESNSDESNESSSRPSSRQRSSSRRKAPLQSTTTSTESNGRKKSRVSSTERSFDSNENTSRSSRRKVSRVKVEPSTSSAPIVEPRQARTRSRVKVIKKEPESRLNVVPNSNEKQASQIEDFATASTKDFEVRMSPEGLNLVSPPVTSRNSIRVSRQQTISVESKTEKAIRKVFRKKSALRNTPSQTTSQEVPSSSEGSVERVIPQSFVKTEGRNVKTRVPQAAQRRTIVSSNKQKSTELTSSEEAIGGEENYPVNFIANIKAKQSKKGTGSSSSQSSKDSLTKTIEKGAASASLETPSPSESAIVPSYANNLESSSQKPEGILKPKKLAIRPVFGKRAKTETEKPVATTTPNSVPEASTASENNQTPLQKYHARFKLNRNQNQKEVIVTSPRPIHKSRSYLPKAPKGIYSSKKLSRSTTVSPVTETEKLKKINIEASALSTQVPPKGANQSKVTRFSARYRNDILARPGVLRTSTSGPSYIPTVPTVTPSPSSVKIEDNLLGLEVISIDDPIINTVPSANLINGDYIPAQNNSTPLGSKEGEDQKPISIIERIINSITSISTTTSPDSNTTITTTTNERPTTESAIQKLVSKKSRSTLDEDFLDKLTTTSNVKTTQKPTTVIEKILTSLSALRANQATEINSQQVGGNYNTLAGVSSTESISELVEKSSTTLPSTPSPLTSDSSTGTPTSTASSSSTVGSTDSSIPSTLLSLNDISTFSLDTGSVSSSTLNPTFAIQDLTSDQTLPKRTIDQLLSLFNMQTSTTTEPETSEVVVVTPKLTTFVTSNTITPTPSVTSTDLPTTVVTSNTETDNTTPRVITTSTLISILTTRIEPKDFEAFTATSIVTETRSDKLISPTTNPTTTDTTRTVTVTPVTDSGTTQTSTTNIPTVTEPTSTLIPSTLLTTVSSNTEPSNTRITTYLTTPDPNSESSTSFTATTLSPDQSTTASTPLPDQTTFSPTLSTTLNTINDAENFINPLLLVNVQNLRSNQIVSTIIPEQTTTVSTPSPDQTSTTDPTLTPVKTSTVSSDQTSTIAVSTVSSDQTSTLTPTQTPTASSDQTSTIIVSTVSSDQASTTVPTLIPSTTAFYQTTPTINDAENFINPLSVTDKNLQPEILSIIDLIAQIMDQTKPPSGSGTSTLSPEFEASTINPIFYTTNANFATASENIPVITKFSSPLLDQVVSSTDSSFSIISTTDLPLPTVNEFSTNVTPTTTPSGTLTTSENTMLDSSSNSNTETTTDASSTIPNLEKFKVSVDRVKVSSANDVSSTLTPDDDDDVPGTTISIISRNFIPDTNSLGTAEVTSVKPVNNSLDSTTQQDISSNTIDSIEITDKLNGTDVSNLVNPLSSDTNVSVTATSLSSSNNITSVNNTRAGKLILEQEDPIRGNSIDSLPRDKDYYIFAVLQNNTILRKRPSRHPTRETPFLIYGLLPNNTLLRRFLNGTVVPMEPVIQVNGFDTRENPPPITESNNINQVTSNQESQPENISTTTEKPIEEANELSLNGDFNNTQENAIPRLTELLGKNTVRAFNNIVNQTQGTQNQTVQVITLQVDPKIENRLNAQGNTASSSSSAKPPSTTTKVSTTKVSTTKVTTTKVSTTKPPTTLSSSSTEVVSESKTVPVIYTSPVPTTTTRKQTKPTTTTPKRITTTIRNEESNNEIEPNPLSIPSRTSATKITVPPTTTSKAVKDISLEELKKKNLTEQQKKDLATLEALEKEHQSILQQLSFLTKLNFGGLNSSKSNTSNQVDVKTQKAEKTVKVTTGSPIIELLNQINGKGVTPPSQVLGSTYGKTNDALLASLLKEYGVVPTPPKPLADVLSQITDTTTGLPSTTLAATKKRVPTTEAPNRFMQGLNWLINTIAPQPTKRPITKSKSSKSNRLNEENEVLSKQPTEITPTIVEAPITQSINSLGIPQERLHALIKQLEEVKRNPESMKNLDVETLKTLQKLKSKDIKDIKITASSSLGATTKKFIPTRMPHFLPTMQNFGEFEVAPLINRGRPDRATTRNPLLDISDIGTTTIKLPPVKLNPVKGIPDEEPLIQGQLVNYAIDVTKAISSFLGNALQGAATSFRSMIGSGSRTSRNQNMFNSPQRTG